jgi:hypothetical protein
MPSDEDRVLIVRCSVCRSGLLWYGDDPMIVVPCHECLNNASSRGYDAAKRIYTAGEPE